MRQSNYILSVTDVLLFILAIGVIVLALKTFFKQSAAAPSAAAGSE
jgi:hypothetical protein